MKKFKVPSMLVIEYKKRNDCKISHLGAKLIASNLDKYEAILHFSNLNPCIKALSQK